MNENTRDGRNSREAGAPDGRDATALKIQTVRGRSGNVGAPICAALLARLLRASLCMASLAILATLPANGSEAAEPERITVASGDSFAPMVFLNTPSMPWVNTSSVKTRSLASA